MSLGREIQLKADGSRVAVANQWVYLDSALTLTAGTVGSTYQDVPWADSGALSLVAGGKYQLHWHGGVSTTGTGEGYSLRIAGPSDLMGQVRSSLSSSATNPSLDVSSLVVGEWTLTQSTAIGATSRLFWIEATLIATTGGALTLQFRTESTSGSNTATLQSLTDAHLERVG